MLREFYAGPRGSLAVRYYVGYVEEYLAVVYL